MLINDEKMYEQLKTGLKSMHVVVHAIYEPDYGDIYGDCYRAAVDLFAPGITFLIFFRLEDDQLEIVDVERYCME